MKQADAAAKIAKVQQAAGSGGSGAVECGIRDDYGAGGRRMLTHSRWKIGQSSAGQGQWIVGLSCPAKHVLGDGEFQRDAVKADASRDKKRKVKSGDLRTAKR